MAHGVFLIENHNLKRNKFFKMTNKKNITKEISFTADQFEIERVDDSVHLRLLKFFVAAYF
jgi:hypothetical protein